MSTSTCVPGSSLRDRDIRESNARVHGVAVAATRDAADGFAAERAHRLRAESDRARIVEHEAHEPLRRSRVERIPADEVSLVALHREPEARLERRGLRREVASPRPVALLEAERVDRAVPARDEPVRLACCDERVPESRTVFRRAVELPAELADVRDPRCNDGDRADRELSCAHVGKVERRLRQRLQHGPCVRPPETEARVGGRCIVDDDGAVTRRMLLDPGAVVIAERGAGDEHETVRGASEHR